MKSQTILTCPPSSCPPQFQEVVIIGKKGANALQLAKDATSGKFLWVKEWQLMKNLFTGSF
jgi:hypothetical protein